MKPIVKHGGGDAKDVGKVFISYLNNCNQDVQNANAIIAYLENRGISVVPKKYFEDITGLICNLSEVDGVKCGVVIVNKNNQNDRRINFEIGMLASRGIKVLPFCTDGVLPSCISSLQYSNSPEQLFQYIQKYGNEYGNLYGDETSDEKLNQEVIECLEVVDLTIDIVDVPVDVSPAPGNDVKPQGNNLYTLMDYLKFGYQIISFGEYIGNNESLGYNNSHRSIISKVFFTEKVNITDGILNVHFSIPVHKGLGVTFKLFVDSPNWQKVNDIYKILKYPSNNEKNDVVISDSAEKQRVYFLIPPDEKNILKVVEAPDGIPNNFIKPSIAW